MRFSSTVNDFVKNEFSLIQNKFIQEYISHANELQLKVYLYGILLCEDPNTNDEIAINMSAYFDVTERDILNAFKYWKDLGIIEIVSETPLSVRYLKIDEVAKPILKTSKYKDFPQKLSSVLNAQILTINESYAVINFLDDKNFDSNALLKIAECFFKLKGYKNFTIKYLLTIANDWANQGIKTLEDVEDKISDLEHRTEETKRVFNALKIKRTPSYADKDLVDSWLKLGFNIETIIYSVNTVKGAKSIDKLDNKLHAFADLGIFTIKEIEEYTSKMRYMRAFSKRVFTNLSLYVQNPDVYIDEFFVKWFGLGFEEETILDLAKHLGLQGKGNIKLLDNYINVLYKKGICTHSSYLQYISNEIQIDKKVSRILNMLGIKRNVSDNDRKIYRTWVEDWGFSEDAIHTVIQNLNTTYYSMKIVNSYLIQLKNKGIYSIDGIKEYMNTTNNKNYDKKQQNNNMDEEELNEFLKILNTGNDILKYIDEE